MPTPGPRRWIDPATRDYAFDTAVVTTANLLPAPGAVTWAAVVGAPIITTGQPDPLGGTSAVAIADANAGSILAADLADVAYTSGDPVLAGLWLKKEGAPPSFAEVRLDFDGATLLGGVLFNLATGAAATWGTGTGVYTSISVAEAIAGWWRLQFSHPGQVATTITMRVHPAAGTTYPGRASSATGTARVYAPSIQLVRARTYGSPRVDQTLASSVLLALSMERGSCPLYEPEEQIGSRLHTITKATDDAVILARAYALEALRPLRAQLHELQVEPSIVDLYDGSRRVGKALHLDVSWREGGRGGARKSVPYQTRIGG